jgi:hypothetical protein
LFGKLKNKPLERKVLQQGGRIMNYHPQLENTLLGYRLFQMDILILYNHTVDLPMDNGNYILGKGESAPNLYQNRQGMNRFIDLINRVKNNYGQSHRSYIITDFTREITFTLRGDSLSISETPYYFCWRYKYDRSEYNQRKVQNATIQALNQRRDRDSKNNPEQTRRQWLINVALEAAEEYQEKHGFYESGTVVDLVAIPDRAQRRAFLEKYHTESIFQLLVNLQSNMDAYQVDHLEEYSKEISDNPDRIRAINPAVWNATVATMRYAAFFRYCKQNFPKQWEALLSEIENVVVEPMVETPTVMYPTGNRIIEQALR